MKLLKTNSPKNRLAVDDLTIPFSRLLWAIAGVVAVWLNVDLPNAVGEDTTLNLAISGLSLVAANVLFRLINDNSASKDVNNGTQ